MLGSVQPAALGLGVGLVVIGALVSVANEAVVGKVSFKIDVSLNRRRTLGIGLALAGVGVVLIIVGVNNPRRDDRAATSQTSSATGALASSVSSSSSAVSATSTATSPRPTATSPASSGSAPSTTVPSTQTSDPSSTSSSSLSRVVFEAPTPNQHVSESGGVQASGIAADVGSTDSVWLLDFDGNRFTADQQAALVANRWSAESVPLGDSSRALPYDLTEVVVIADPRCQLVLAALAQSQDSTLASLPQGCQVMDQVRVVVAAR